VGGRSSGSPGGRGSNDTVTRHDRAADLAAMSVAFLVAVPYGLLDI